MALKKRVKKEAKPSKMKVTKKDIETFAEEYDRISQQIKELDSRKKELAAVIKESAVEIGTVDDKGSHYVDTDTFICGSVRNQKVTIDNEKAYAYLTTHKDKKGGDFNDCIQQVTKYVVDEDALGKAVQDDRVDINTLRENCYNINISYSVSVKKKEVEAEMPEVEQTSLKKAARRK